MRPTIFILSSFLLLSLAPGFAQVTLGEREVLLDNDSVEVVRLVYPAGTESGVHTHTHPNRVVYVVKGGKLELIPFDKEMTPKVVDVLAGSVLYLPAVTHNVRNIGVSEIILIETEIK